jgi:hypothetical protein
VAEDLDAVGGQPVLVDGSGVNRDIIPVEKPPLLYQDRSLLLHVLHEDNLARSATKSQMRIIVPTDKDGRRNCLQPAWPEYS